MERLVEGQVSATSAQWASVVRAMYPGFTDAYPPIQEYHGTADTALLPENLGEEIKQWAGIFGYNAAAPTQVLQNTPLAGYTKSIYGPNLQGIFLSRLIGASSVPTLSFVDRYFRRGCWAHRSDPR